MKQVIRRSILSLGLVVGVLSAGLADAENVIVRTSKPYTKVKASIVALGGTVTYEFKHANGLAAVVPDDKVNALKSIRGVEYYVRDLVVPAPKPKETVDLSGQVQADLGSNAAPANYFPYGSELTDAFPLLSGGILGNGVVVGIIDSGTSRTATALCDGPCATGTRVIGGESFVPTEPDATASTNYPHGTWVACMIGANRLFGFLNTSTLARAVRNYCTPAASSPCSFPASATVDAIPMVGQAPAARFFALKVFPASGAGAPTSRIMQAMDRAIELKGSTQPDMKVVNMSLGGSTLFAGGDIEDELATSMAAAGITLVVSAGNTGPSGSTVGSPGTAQSILTAGAASSPVHERILRDVQYGIGVGALYRPDSNQQMAYFSSRGPDASGRVHPSVVANGFASYAQGANGSISLVSGTSFSAPTVSGVAALLYSAVPTATPEQVRSAIIATARPGVIPTASFLDEGAGYVDAAASLARLASSPAPIPDPAPEKKKVSQNVKEGAGINPIDASQFSTHVANLRPAERREFYFTVDKNTAAVRVSLANITPELPPSGQNAFFGDDVFLTIHSAKTSAIGAEGDYLAYEFVNADQTFVFDRPETGLIRVTVNGDWTNAGRISADLSISEDRAPLPRHSFQGKISEGQTLAYTVVIPPGTASATFRLSWNNDWSSYPTNDLDMYLVPFGEPPNFDGATLNSPESVTITNPVAGPWTIQVNGYTVFGGDDRFEIRVDY
jgi:subtilisin family serine protease